MKKIYAGGPKERQRMSLAVSLLNKETAELGREEAGWEWLDEDLVSGDNTEEAAFARIMAEQLGEHLSNLVARQRRALEGCVLDKKTSVEIGRRLGVSSTRARQIIFDAGLKLRLDLEFRPMKEFLR